MEKFTQRKECLIYPEPGSLWLVNGRLSIIDERYLRDVGIVRCIYFMKYGSIEFKEMSIQEWYLDIGLKLIVDCHKTMGELNDYVLSGINNGEINGGGT